MQRPQMKSRLQLWDEREPGFQIGDQVRTLSGGPAMEVTGLQGGGLVACRLNGKTFVLAATILRHAELPSARELGLPRRGRVVSSRRSLTVSGSGTPSLATAPGQVFSAIEVAAMRDAFAGACARLRAEGDPALRHEIAVAVLRSWSPVSRDDGAGTEALGGR
ncbi:MAG: hypothetical protein ACT6XY_05205 [Phreatobacter sp.]|jgi:hypothetical protein|uniref:hypothetical protein n=2 Tax=Phreatobacter sp. TaxID=1966341 RepID=UPI004036CC0B